MKLSILIPVYNEERTLKEVLDRVRAVQLGDIDKEILVVNDGSTDQTAEILNQYQDDPLVKPFHFQVNQGKTAALLHAVEKATGDLFLVQDADLEYDPEQYPKLLAPILDNNADIVYGSRFKGTIKEMKWINRAANVFSNFVFNLFYPVKVTDINTCFKVFKRDVFQKVNIVSKDFTFETEVTAKLVNRGHQIVEVPIDYVARSRQAGKKINWRKAWDMFWGIIKYRHQTT